MGSSAWKPILLDKGVFQKECELGGRNLTVPQSASVRASCHPEWVSRIKRGRPMSLQQRNDLLQYRMQLLCWNVLKNSVPVSKWYLQERFSMLFWILSNLHLACYLSRSVSVSNLTQPRGYPFCCSNYLTGPGLNKSTFMGRGSTCLEVHEVGATVRNKRKRHKKIQRHFLFSWQYGVKSWKRATERYLNLS